MKTLVTGGAGFIGSHLVDRLLEDGHEVHVWDDLSNGKIENLPEHRNLTFNQFKVDEIHGHNKTDWRLLGAGTKYDTIFHLAAESRIPTSLENPERCIQSNVIGVRNILEVARRHKAKLVFTSTCAAFGDKFLNPYVLSKVHGEELCMLYQKLYSMPIAITRLFNVYGARQSGTGAYATVIAIFAKQTKEGQKLTITGDGKQSRDFIHVADVVDCLIELSEGEWKCEIFQVGTGKGVSINDLAEMFQPGNARLMVPQRMGEMRNVKADLRLGLIKWNAKRKLKDYINELIQQTASQSDP